MLIYVVTVAIAISHQKMFENLTQNIIPSLVSWVFSVLHFDQQALTCVKVKFLPTGSLDILW
jgi:hypothetical protein